VAVQSIRFGSWFRYNCSGFEVKGYRFSVQVKGLGFRGYGSRFEVKNSGLKV
jgi:hypothetical protein